MQQCMHCYNSFKESTSTAPSKNLFCSYACEANSQTTNPPTTDYEASPHRQTAHSKRDQWIRKYKRNNFIFAFFAGFYCFYYLGLGFVINRFSNLVPLENTIIMKVIFYSAIALFIIVVLLTLRMIISVIGAPLRLLSSLITMGAIIVSTIVIEQKLNGLSTILHIWQLLRG